jgi:hypothetical protein
MTPQRTPRPRHPTMPEPSRTAPVQKGRHPTTSPPPANEAVFPMSLVVQVTGTEGDLYTVTFGTFQGQPWPAGWSCTCSDYLYRQKDSGTHCKHIVAVAAVCSPNRLGRLR